MKYLWDFLIIVMAVGVWEVCYDTLKWWMNKEIASIFCEGCKKPRNTKRTKDKRYWLCRTCKKIYEEECTID